MAYRMPYRAPTTKIQLTKIDNKLNPNPRRFEMIATGTVMIIVRINRINFIAVITSLLS